ncbi:MAG: carbohydrate ABC transporter permease [Streptosporangiales bacterium]|nr:carbohydrate ABC transporter permease [Streptosporangiales bacterium]MBO0891367.1 carbohydrate ABC transporter permease [Acidothermales bacterium]
MTTVTDTDTAAPARTYRTRRRLPIARAVVIVVVALFAVWTLWPLYWMLSTSLKTSREATSLTPTVWPHSLDGSHYTGLFTGSLPFTNYFVNSIFTSLVSALVAVLISTLAGYSFSRGGYRLNGALSLAVLATQMLPLVVLIAPLYLLLLKAHLLNTYLGLVIGYTSFGIPFGAWMMKGFFDGVPREIEEAARVDGYSRFGILFRVVIPLSVPGLVTTGVFVFMNTWNNLLYPLTLINSDQKQTLPPGLLQSFSGTFKTDWGGMMAASIVTSLPLVIAFFLVQRSMVRGLTAGALAGT